MNRYMPRNVRKLASAISVILPFSPLAVVASQEVVPMPSAIGAADVMGVGSGLVVVIAAIMLVGFWYSKSRAVHGSDNNVIKILATQTLGPKERIVLIEVADKQMVLGMTSSQVQTLHVFDESVVDTSEQTISHSFVERLKSAVRANRK